MTTRKSTRIIGIMCADQQFISKVEAARRLGCDRETIYAAIRRGDLIVDERGRILRAPFEAMIAILTKGVIP
jgi:hypothetical protein